MKKAFFSSLLCLFLFTCGMEMESDSDHEIMPLIQTGSGNESDLERFFDTGSLEHEISNLYSQDSQDNQCRDQCQYMSCLCVVATSPMIATLAFAFMLSYL